MKRTPSHGLDARRGGKVAVLVVLVIAAVGGMAGWRVLSGQSGSGAHDTPLTTPVKVGPFVYEVVERGEIESSSNVEIRCEVRSRNSSGTTILQIVPEGTYVEKDDFLVKLDDSTFQTELLQQEIICNTGQSQVIEATADERAAHLALEEYQAGTFKQDREQLESAEFVAKENLRRAEEYLRYSERLAERGYISEVQLEADRFAVGKARKELDVALTRLEVLIKYTKQKMLNQLQAAIETSGARLKSRQNSYKLDMARLMRIKDQIAKCVIRAPAAGQVVFANDTRSQSSNNGDVLITEGRQVRERQVIIRLPDPKRMQVVAKINESRIDRVKEGMRAKIVLDAFPDLELTGVVRKVSEYPIRQTARFLEHVKEYATEIVIENPPDGLRAGMTAQVAVRVEQLENAVQIPPQAVFEREGHYYCLLSKAESGLEAREVHIGSSNEKYLVVEDGLNAGEQVVLTPEDYEQNIDLPTAKTVVQTPAAAKRQTRTSDRKDAMLVQQPSRRKDSRR